MADTNDLLYKKFPPLIGLKVADAGRKAIERHFAFRTITIDNEADKRSRIDFNDYRVNVFVNNGIVVGYDFY